MALVETLIGALIFAFVIAGVYLLYTTMQNSMNRGQLMSDLQQNARIGLAEMTQEIRMAGYDPSGVISLVTTPPKSAIRAASTTCFSFVADVSAPGVGPASQITYDFNASSLRRRQDSWDSGKSDFGGGSAQPLAGSLAALTFTYYDANNQALTPAAWTSTLRCPPDSKAGAQSIMQLTFDQMRLMRRLSITLKTQGSRPGVGSEFFTLTSDVRFRNL